MDNLFDGYWQYVPAEAATHPYQSFALDDLLQEMVTTDGIPKIRSWIHDPYVILGLHDARLPRLKDGLKFLEDSGYDYILRNSGGLGVVLDDGVLNLSLVLPKAAAPQIDDGYEVMLHMVKSAFPHAPIKAYEIVHSYCPGSYDLSIGGLKFAGISQRRIRQGVAVQIYLCVTGSGSLRAEIMRDFYHFSKAADITRFTYPEVHPEDVASLNELLDENYSVEDVLEKMLHVIEASGGTMEALPELDDTQQERYTRSLKRMKQRNEKIRKESDEILFPEL